jgi:choline dehydrogenase
MAEMLAGARLLRALAATPALRAITKAETKPGPETESDAALEADIRARAYSIYHPCGTARMGPDPRTAAVDADCRVHGVPGLRVIDASIMPNITSGNLNAPAMLVGWLGAERLLAG